MSKLIEGFIMSVLVLYCALLAWIGQIQSKSLLSFVFGMPLTPYRFRDKLRSGEMTVSGDNWPIFLYHGYYYDPEDPWNGLFRSAILMSVHTV
jgi:hypothetical protein